MHSTTHTCNIALSAFGWGPARPTLSPPSPTPAGLFGRVDHLMRGEEARPMVVPPLAASARVAAQLNALRLRYLAVLVGAIAFNGAQWWRRACPFAPNAARQRRPAVWRGPGAPAPFARAGPGLHVAMRATSVAQRAGLQRPRDPGQAAFRRICPTDGPAELLGLTNVKKRTVTGDCPAQICGHPSHEQKVSTPQVHGLLYSQPPRVPVQTSQALLASPPAASGSDEAWLALEIDADACTAAPGGAGPGKIRAVTARGELGSS